jgi:hypothetical protein
MTAPPDRTVIDPVAVSMTTATLARRAMADLRASENNELVS